jgi:hypothetical protein
MIAELAEEVESERYSAFRSRHTIILDRCIKNILLKFSAKTKFQDA